MRYLLDTSICIEHLRNRTTALRDRLLTSSAGSVAVCSIVRLELMFAGIALAAGLTLVTGNTAEFGPGLRVEDWRAEGREHA